MRQIGLAAPILEFVSEAVRGERLAVFGDQERHVADVRRRNARRKIGMQRNVDVDRVAMLVLGAGSGYDRLECVGDRGAARPRADQWCSATGPAQVALAFQGDAAR